MDEREKNGESNAESNVGIDCIYYADVSQAKVYNDTGTDKISSFGQRIKF